MIDFIKYREDFPILKRKISEHDLIFFDNAATTQKPNQVIDTVADYYRNYNCAEIGRASCRERV